MNAKLQMALKKGAPLRRTKSARPTRAEEIESTSPVVVDRRRVRRATSIRIPRPYGGTIVLRAGEETAELPAFFEAARSWFAERAAGDVEHDLELALESVEQRARSDNGIVCKRNHAPAICNANFYRVGTGRARPWTTRARRRWQ